MGITERADVNGMTPSHVVLLIHGIRTEGGWQGLVARVLEECAGVCAIPIKYKYFDAFRFWTPFLRAQPIRRIERELNDVRRRFPNAGISVIAHSFGTYAITSILQDRPDIALKRLLLTGSIVPRDFRWDKIADQIATNVLNECGTKDIWPILAGTLSWGYGASGRFGFGSGRVRDRFVPFRHSEFFTETFVREAWLPYLLDGRIVRLPQEIVSESAPWWQSLLTLLPLQWLILSALIVSGAVGIRQAFSLHRIVVTGRLVGKHGAPIPSATILADSYSFSAPTDIEGHFKQILFGPKIGDVVTLRFMVGGRTVGVQAISISSDSIDLDLKTVAEP